jgi:hypothetical protein
MPKNGDQQAKASPHRSPSVRSPSCHRCRRWLHTISTTRRHTDCQHDTHRYRLREASAKRIADQPDGNGGAVNDGPANGDAVRLGLRPANDAGRVHASSITIASGLDHADFRFEHADNVHDHVGTDPDSDARPDHVNAAGYSGVHGELPRSWVDQFARLR